MQNISSYKRLHLLNLGESIEQGDKMEKMTKGTKAGIIILIAFALFVGATFFVTIRSYIKATNWTIHDPMSDEGKELYSNAVLLPGLSACFERYADKGVRDSDYMVETYSYQSVSEMCDALPKGCNEGIKAALDEGVYENAEDIYGTPVKRYQINTGLPLIDQEAVIEKYRYAYAGAFIYYYVLEYSDGTCRFAVLIMDT